MEKEKKNTVKCDTKANTKAKVKQSVNKKQLKKGREHKLSSFEKENHPEMDIKSIKDIKEKIDSDFPKNDINIYSDNYGTSDYQDEINAASQVNMNMDTLKEKQQNIKEKTINDYHEEIHDLKYFADNIKKVKDLEKYDQPDVFYIHDNPVNILSTSSTFTNYKEMLTSDSLITSEKFNKEDLDGQFLTHRKECSLFGYYSGEDNFISDFEYWYWELFYDPDIQSVILKYNNFLPGEPKVCSLSIKLPENMIKSEQGKNPIFNFMHSLHSPDSEYMQKPEEVLKGNWKISIGAFLFDRSDIKISRFETSTDTRTGNFECIPGIMIQIIDTNGKNKFKKYIPDFNSQACTQIIDIISESLKLADEKNHKKEGSFIRDFQLYDLFIRREKFEKDAYTYKINNEIKVSDNIFPVFENDAIPMCINYHLNIIHVNKIRIKVFKEEGTILLNSGLKQVISPFDCENDTQMNSYIKSYPKFDYLKYFINMFDWSIVFDRTFNIFLLKAYADYNSIDGGVMYFPVSGFKDSKSLMNYFIDMVYVFIKYIAKHKKGLKAEWYAGWEEIFKGRIKEKSVRAKIDKDEYNLQNFDVSDNMNNIDDKKSEEIKCFQLNENINNIQDALIYLIKKCDIKIIHSHACNKHNSYDYVLKVMGKEYQFKDFIGKTDYSYYMECLETAIKKTFIDFYGYNLSEMKLTDPLIACTYFTDNLRIFNPHGNYDYITESHSKNIIKNEKEHFYVQFDFSHQKMRISDNYIEGTKNIKEISISKYLLKQNIETELWSYFYTTLFPCFCFTGQIDNFGNVIEIKYDEKDQVYRGNLKVIGKQKTDVGLTILNFSQARKIKRMISSIMQPNVLLPYSHKIGNCNMLIDSNWKLLHNYKDEYYIMLYLESEHGKSKYKRSLVSFSNEDKKSIENFMCNLNKTTLSGMFTKYPLTEEYKWHYENIYSDNDYINPYDEWTIRYSSKDVSYVAEIYGSVFPIDDTDENYIMNIIQKYIRKELDGLYNFIY